MKKRHIVVIIVVSITALLCFGSIYYNKSKPTQEKNYIELKKDMIIRRGVKGAKDIKKYSWIIKKGTRIYFRAE